MNCASIFKVKNEAKFKEAVAISIKELVASLKTTKLNDSLKNEISNLFGINRVYGYINDRENDDIILIGAKYVPANRILLEDFCDILNSVLYSNESPGCSIDPPPAERDSLRKLMEKINKFSDDFIRDRFLSKWKKHPVFHKTRVFGISKNTHIAKVMIDADYLMKKITDGSYKIGVKGFKSYMDLSLEESISKMKKRIPVESKDVFVRFWFSPTENEFLTNENTVFFRNGSVQLLTEEMYWNENDENVGFDRVHPIAQDFVNIFSSKYNKVKSVEPIYAQLETIFRLYILQKMIINNDLYNKKHIDLKYLTNYNSNNIWHVPECLPGVYTFRRKYADDANYKYKVLIPMAGGVLINPELKNNCFKKDTTGNISELENIIFNAKPKNKVISWIFTIPSNLYSLFI